MLLIFIIEAMLGIFALVGIWKEAELIRFEDAVALKIKRIFKKEVK